MRGVSEGGPSPGMLPGRWAPRRKASLHLRPPRPPRSSIFDLNMGALTHYVSDALSSPLTPSAAPIRYYSDFFDTSRGTGDGSPGRLREHDARHRACPRARSFGWWLPSRRPMRDMSCAVSVDCDTGRRCAEPISSELSATQLGCLSSRVPGNRHLCEVFVCVLTGRGVKPVRRSRGVHPLDDVAQFG